MPKSEAYETAVTLAIEKLRKTDLSSRYASLGLPQPQQGELRFRAFGEDMVLHLSDFQVFLSGSGTPVKIGDRILILHYLLCEIPVTFVDRMISFRELTGGQFYWSAFCGRSTVPLEKRFGNDVQQLRKNLNRFDWEPLSIGDLGAKIHIIGNLYGTLIYRLGDDELPPAADFLFDASVKRVFDAEDAAVIASRICLGLL